MPIETALEHDWWKRYNRHEQKDYLKQHPKSRLRVDAPNRSSPSIQNPQPRPVQRPVPSPVPKIDVDPNQFKDAVLQGTNLQGKVKMSPAPAAHGVECFIKTPASETTFMFKQDDDGSKVVDLVEFLVPPRKQGGGVAKKILRNSMNTFKKMGVKKVELDAVSIGSYAWARYGFVPDELYWKKSMKRRIEGRAAELCDRDHQDRRQLFDRVLQALTDDPHSIWDIADVNAEIQLDGGESIPIGKALLIDNSWAGYLALDDEQAMRRFNAYTGAAA